MQNVNQWKIKLVGHIEISDIFNAAGIRFERELYTLLAKRNFVAR